MNRLIAELVTRGEAETAALARRFAADFRPGDVICLSGDLGSGKSVFARAAIRSRAGSDIDVPSPTFTLVQSYQAPALEIWHVDLYRVNDAAEIIELGLEDAFEHAATLIEWPERAGRRLPGGRLEIRFGFCHSVTHRALALHGNADWERRVQRILKECEPEWDQDRR